MLKETILKIQEKQDLSSDEAKSCLDMILNGNIEEFEIIELLKALCEKGEAVSEIVGFARALQGKMSKVEIEDDAIDLCGTGGSGLSRFNISTTVAFVLAAAGVKVAKHGNKGSKTNNGSFDLLEELGISLDTTPEQEASLFREKGLCFLFARTHHPAMKAVGPARAKLGRRSIFNLIGPLCNPANVNYQIVGVSDESLGEKMAEVMKLLGKKRALIVYGEPGIDEFSISGKSHYWLVEKGEVKKYSCAAKDFGIEEQSYETLPGGDCKENAKIFIALLSGQYCDGLQDMAALNAGAAFFTIGHCDTIEEGYSLAKELLNSKKVLAYFEDYRDFQS